MDAQPREHEAFAAQAERFELVQALLPSAAGPPARVYQPGGIGALTYSEVVKGARPQPREWIAFSSGSLLNLVQGRFGPWRPDRIRWVAGLAQDHGVVAVHRDAPWRSLQAVRQDLRDADGAAPARRHLLDVVRQFVPTPPCTDNGNGPGLVRRRVSSSAPLTRCHRGPGVFPT